MEYREYRPGDEKGLNDLYNEVFSRERTIEQWKWLYIDAPAGPSKIVVIEHDGEIVGHEAMIPLHFRIEDGECIGGKFEDVYISARHQGKGLSGPLVDHCLEVSARAGYGFSFGMAARKVPFRTHVKKGYRHLCSLNAYFAPIRPTETVADVSRALRFSRPKRALFGATISLLAKRFESKIGRLARVPDSFHIDRIDRFDARFDELWEEFARSQPLISIKRSSAFLNWRYIDNPYRRYALFSASAGGRLVGYLCAAVVTREDMDLRLRVGVVADFLLLPGYDRAYSSLVRAAVNAWRSGGADVGITWLHKDGAFSRPLLAELKRRGLVSTFGRYDIPVIVRPLAPGIDANTLYKTRLWHVTQAFNAAWV